ncbi:hypothetical protein J4223_01365 [Candidatus Woesearchaeota archaeon]|nr:hypothetical protein [Candidatus Woesearchaeota archaeon]
MQRFPNKGYGLPEDALRKCLSAGNRCLSGAEFALERAVNNKKGSFAWKVYPHTDTLVGVGLFAEKPTLLVRHGDNILSTPEGIARLRAQGSQRNKFQLLTEEDRQLWQQYCEQGLEEREEKRQTWVIQGKALDGMVSGIFSLEDAPHQTAMVPILGDLLIVDDYSRGHKINIGPQIGVGIDNAATSSKVPLVCPLVFGDDYGINLDGFNDFIIYNVGCVVGVPSSATQKILEPKKGSPLALMLKGN